MTPALSYPLPVSLILPTGRDNEVCQKVLFREGIQSFTYQSVTDFSLRKGKQTPTVVLVAEEALDDTSRSALQDDCLRQRHGVNPIAVLLGKNSTLEEARSLQIPFDREDVALLQRPVTQSELFQSLKTLCYPSLQTRTDSACVSSIHFEIEQPGLALAFDHKGDLIHLGSRLSEILGLATFSNSYTTLRSWRQRFEDISASRQSKQSLWEIARMGQSREAQAREIWDNAAGKTWKCDVSVESIRDEREEICATIFRFEDLTERIKEAETLSRLEFQRLGHDIRNSLSTIAGLGEILRQESPEIVAEYGEAIQRSGEYIAELLNHAGREQAGEEGNRNTTRVVPVLDSIAATFGPLAAQKKIDFNLDSLKDEEVFVRCPEADFERILANLLGNAIKATEGGCIELSATYLSSELTVSVSDTGSGADEDFLRTRLDDKPWGASEKRGMGLGIVGALVNGHQGRVSVSSEIGKGTRFEIKLPATALSVSNRAGGAPESERSAARAAEVSSEAQREAPILLVVDDYPSTAQAVELLVGDRWKIRAATNFNEAEAHLQSAPPAIALIDVHVEPGVQTHCWLDDVRSRGLLNDTVLVVSSGDLSGTVRRRMHHVGVKRFLKKPFTQADLLAVLKHAAG